MKHCIKAVADLKADIYRQLKRITLVLALLATLCIWQLDFVMSAINANVFLNASIILVFFFGVLLLYRHCCGIFNEATAMEALRSDYSLPETDRGKLLDQPATVYRQPIILSHAFSLLHEEIQSTGRLAIGTATMQNLIGGVEVRFDDQKSLVQYVTGLLVFLGLIGTFVGLMQTVSAVGDIIGSLDFRSGGDVTETVSNLITSLKGPLVGMGTGFSSSLFGLITSLALGLMGRFGAAAANAFKSSFEVWLASVAKLESVWQEGQNQNANQPVAASNGGHHNAPEMTKIIGRIENLIHAVEALTAASKVHEQAPLAISSKDRRVNKADRLIIAELQKLNDAIRSDTDWRRQLEGRLDQIASIAELGLKPSAELEPSQTYPTTMSASKNNASLDVPSGRDSAFNNAKSNSWWRWSRFGFHRPWDAPAATLKLRWSKDMRQLDKTLRAMHSSIAGYNARAIEDAVVTRAVLKEMNDVTWQILRQMEKQEASNREFLFILTELRRDRRDQREERRVMRQNILATERTMWQISDQIKESSKTLNIREYV